MASSIDYGLLRGLLTVLIFAAFMGVVFWAWSSRRKADFKQAAQLPLEDSGPADPSKETDHVE